MTWRGMLISLWSRANDQAFEQVAALRPSARGTMRLYGFWLTICICIGALASPAQARWKEQYANAPDGIKQWYTAQHNKNGGWCCDEADGHAFYGSYSRVHDGSIEFDVDGVHHRLPSYMILDGPNPTGHAVWWYTDQPDGVHRDYCFALGAEG